MDRGVHETWDQAWDRIVDREMVRRLSTYLRHVTRERASAGVYLASSTVFYRLLPSSSIFQRLLPSSSVFQHHSVSSSVVWGFAALI